MTFLELLGTIGGAGAGGAAAKAGFDYLRARAESAAASTTTARAADVERVRVETGADLTLNERLWARVAQLESRLDEERDDCDAKLEDMRRQVEALNAVCVRQETEITDLRRDKDSLVREAKKLADKVAALTREPA